MFDIELEISVRDGFSESGNIEKHWHKWLLDAKSCQTIFLYP